MVVVSVVSRRSMVGHMNLRHPSYVYYMGCSFRLTLCDVDLFVLFRFVICVVEAARFEVSSYSHILLCF